MNKDEIRYLYLEIIEEGTLNFAFKWMNHDFGWSIEYFAEMMVEINNQGIANFYTYDKGRNIVMMQNVRREDFGSIDKLKNINFSPTDKFFQLYDQIFI